MKYLLLNTYLFFVFNMHSHVHQSISSCNIFQKKDKNKGLIGVWTTENRDLKVEVFEMNGVLYGKLVDFVCNHKEKKPLIDHKDDKNPNVKLRERSWLNSIILYGLKYSSDNKWSGGLIYDLTTGKTYSASVTLSNNTIVVRGYYGFEFIGKSIIFKKIT